MGIIEHEAEMNKPQRNTNTKVRASIRFLHSIAMPDLILPLNVITGTHSLAA